MSQQSALIASDINAYLAQHEQKELLRLITCGSVDDGKSTLIGRLFYESKMIYEDQLAALQKDTSRYGTTGEALDLALFTDGLEDERQQGITIDVAYPIFQPISESSSSLIRRGTSSTHATWQRGLPLPIWRSF